MAPRYPVIVDTYIEDCRQTVLLGNTAASAALTAHTAASAANKERAKAALDSQRDTRDRAKTALEVARAIPYALEPVTLAPGLPDYTGRATVLAAIARSRLVVLSGNTAAQLALALYNASTGTARTRAKTSLDAIRAARDRGKTALANGREADDQLMNPT